MGLNRGLSFKAKKKGQKYHTGDTVNGTRWSVYSVSVYEIIPWKLSQNRGVKRYKHASDRTLHRVE